MTKPEQQHTGFSRIAEPEHCDATGADSAGSSTSPAKSVVDGERLRVGDWCWNKRQSCLDLKPGWLIEITDTDLPHFPYKGRAVLIDADFNDVGYCFNDGDLELAFRATAE